ncbi:hypothetical protein BO86DRAFT_97934 [Aspergillus japonicus CBS 114.51]|uniref:Uncharacterized protein n=1 Tax=Aspergillus japonicus CBS 114.51 TaxID=1448312 RepID=A0A8T8X015_ASPJA|nr:hypothetical protein BO86DRAFT_97934 [Aspergillus japonicus CBS 114.51]RAH81467.1 hypothetical protein BO86DRAFT_97934 [Aspergillus japonicus CBS 114.51]
MRGLYDISGRLAVFVQSMRAGLVDDFHDMVGRLVYILSLFGFLGVRERWLVIYISFYVCTERAGIYGLYVRADYLLRDPQACSSLAYLLWPAIVL